jgi:hypothetical protein
VIVALTAAGVGCALLLFVALPALLMQGGRGRHAAPRHHHAHPHGQRTPNTTRTRGTAQ